MMTHAPIRIARARELILAKGLALGASVGLALASLLGTPAGAAVLENAELVVAPSPADIAARKQKLDAMVNTDVPQALWSSLRVVTVPKDTGADGVGEPVAFAPMAKDHAVLLVMFDPANAASVEEAQLAQRVMDRYAQYNVRMLGVVRASDEQAVIKMYEDDALGLMTAVDTDGALSAHFIREPADVSPGVQYAIVDHAGVVRSADLPRRTVRTMLTRVAGERRAALDDAERRERQAANGGGQGNDASPSARPGSGAGGSNPLAVLADDYLPASESAYDVARWPNHNTSVGTAARNLQGQALPAIPGQETWLTQTVDAEARVIVLDFWATWCGPCLAAEPKLESMQRVMSNDILVVAMSGQARGSSYPEDENAIRTFLSRKAQGPQYAHAHDQEQRLYRGFGIRAIPHVVVVSTDGVVRWQGNPHSEEFNIAVGQVARVDPGLAARKAGTMPVRATTTDGPTGGMTDNPAPGTTVDGD